MHRVAHAFWKTINPNNGVQGVALIEAVVYLSVASLGRLLLQYGNGRQNISCFCEPGKQKDVGDCESSLEQTAEEES